MKRRRWLKYGLIAVAIIFLLYLPGIVQAVTGNNNPQRASTSSENSSQEQIPPNKEELLRLVNEERAKAGVTPLDAEKTLEMSAQYKADDLNARNYFTHEDPTTGKNNGILWAYDNGAACSYISENLVDTTNARLVDDVNREAVASWLNSPSHRQALLDARYETTGFGISNGKIVQHFCDK